ncbi:MAG: 4-hydroxy-3-methylbut-2-en-yl diphosphate reductase [Phycisphaerales bacterium]|jgi:4-hydroxy-3-methylbut-2-enyl diphosphate reductase|nr:4-hydroxy-3-methylbut-2-en-yl diphosphate reductase [Phycisphaerales bacterium]MEA2736146.1 4-hydroxy-3-methylbut-2-en-yl diphosphate reductase [Humisphaera sp.]
MKIILANPRGFCAGVNMAIDTVDQVLRTRGSPVYVYHEIVHNKHVVEGFEGRGVTFVNDIEEVPAGGVVVYSAHGISPEVRRKARERRLVEVDATCPLVTKVHMEVLRYARDGCTILFVGHRHHDEAIGTIGEAPNQVVIVESPEEVEALEIADPEKLAFVTQTTLSVSDAMRTITAIKQKFPNVRYPTKDDICYATTNRQAAVTQLASDADIVLVVGSKNSSNSRRLVERAVEQGKPAYLVDDASEVDLSWFAGKKCCLVTAGASAPEHLVQELITRLQKEIGGGEVEQRTLVEEDVFFDLPKSAKSLSVLA